MLSSQSLMPPPSKKSRKENEKEGDGNDSFDEDDIDPRPSTYMMSQQPHLSQQFTQHILPPKQKPLTPRRTSIPPSDVPHPTGAFMLMTNRLHNEQRNNEKLERENQHLKIQNTQLQKEKEQTLTRLQKKHESEIQSLRNTLISNSFNNSLHNSSVLNATTNSQPTNIMDNSLNESLTSPSASSITTKKVISRPSALSNHWNRPTNGGFKRPATVLNHSFVHQPSQNGIFNPNGNVLPPHVPIVYNPSPEKVVEQVTCGTQADMFSDLSKRTVVPREDLLGTVLFASSTDLIVPFNLDSIKGIVSTPKQLTFGKGKKPKKGPHDSSRYL